MSEFVITYGKSRFPNQPRRDDGSWGCRGCGGELPKGRSAWCSKACCDRFHPAFVIAAVKRRDKEICDECGYDAAQAEKDWWIKRSENDKRYRAGDLSAVEHYRLHTEWVKARPSKIEYDHIIPFSEGGLTVIENIRSLCEVCHKNRTKWWHRERKLGTVAELQLA